MPKQMRQKTSEIYHIISGAINKYYGEDDKIGKVY
jgi:hypothetical protein